MILRKVVAGVFVMTAVAVSVSAQENNPRIERTVVFGEMSSSFIGVETKEITKDNYAQYGLSAVRGVIVESVLENSPAAKAGIIKGDVILKFDDESVTSVRKLQRLVSEISPDQTANVTVIRNRAEIKIPVIVGKREQPLIGDGEFRFEPFPEMPIPGMPGFELQIPRGGQGETRVFSARVAGRQIGVSVSPLTKQLSTYFGVASGNGLLISEVTDGSPASKAGLRAGDVIVTADGSELKENMDLVRAINKNKEGVVVLSVIRDKKQISVTVSPEEIQNGVPTMDRFLLRAPIGAIRNKPFLKLRTPEEPIVIKIHQSN